MNDSFSWQYDEFEQVGTDYGSKTEAEIYDSIQIDGGVLGTYICTKN